jgi:hypothetical protein
LNHDSLAVTIYTTSSWPMMHWAKTGREQAEDAQGKHPETIQIPSPPR